MEQVMAVLAFVQERWSDILAGITMLIGGASILVTLTPTTKDDDFIAKIKSVLSVIALNPKQSQKA